MTTVSDLSIEYLVYEQDVINPLKVDVPIQLVRSTTNTKKTQTAIQFIKKLQETEYKNKPFKCYYFTSRKTFAKSLKNTLMEHGLHFSLYLDCPNIAKKKNVIIQIESLNKLNSAPDLLILDECISLLSQLSSPLHKERLYMNHSAFEGCIKTAKQIVCLDADLHDQRLFEMLKAYRPKDKILFQYNTKKKQGVTAYEYNSKYGCEEQLRKEIKEEKNIFIVVGSIEHGKRLIEDMLKEVRYKFYNAETSDDEFQNVLVNEEWTKYQVVMITSTITNGVDFHKLHFHKSFVFGNSSTTHVRDFKQMIGRVRHLKEKELHYFNDCISYTLPITFENVKNEIEGYLNETNRNMNKYLTAPQLAYLSHKFSLKIDESTKTFNYVLDDSDFFVRLFILNQMEVNASRNSFNILFKEMLKEDGYLITERKVLLDNVCAISKQKHVIRDRVRNKNIQIFDNTILPTKEEFIEINQRVETSKASVEDKRIVSKYNFCNMFMNESDISGKDFETHKHHLKEMQNLKIEKEIAEGMLSIKHIIIKDLQAARGHQRHVYCNPINAEYSAIQLLCEKIGIQGTFDTTTIVYSPSLMETLTWFQESFPSYKRIFKLINKDPDDLNSFLRCINSIFSKWSKTKLSLVSQYSIQTKKIYGFQIKINNSFKMLSDNIKIFISKDNYDLAQLIQQTLNYDRTQLIQPTLLPIRTRQC